jgi:hypothetical protein
MKIKSELKKNRNLLFNLIQKPNTDPYAFVEFADTNAAAAALSAMNKRSVLGKVI